MPDVARRTDRQPDAVEFACVEVAGRTFGVAIESVREILVTPAITPLPDAPSQIEGMIDLRGALVPLVDAASLLLPGDAARGSGARTLIVSVRDLVVGFRVDRVTQVFAAPRSALEPLPELARQTGCRLAAIAVRRPGREPLLVLDLDALVTRVVEAGREGSGRAEVAA